MFKKIKIGLSAMVAFAFMFATSVSVVAQEQANAPTDKVEVKESVKSKGSTETAQGLYSSVKNNKPSTHWYSVSYNPAAPTDETQQLINSTPMDGDPQAPCTVRPDGYICSISFTLPNSSYPVPTTVDDAVNDPNVTNIVRAKTPPED